MKIQKLLLATVLVLTTFLSARAAEIAKIETAQGAECKKGECHTCPIEAAMKQLPTLTFKVNGESLCCPDAAAEKAKELKTELTYVLGEKEFADKAKATLALAEATEQFVAKFVEPKTCEVSGKVTVAGQELCCSVMAAETAKVAKAAMETITVSYLVGEKSCNCPIEAKELAAKTGAQTQFVVLGEKTCCEVTHRLNVARAKYKAAVEAVHKAQVSTQPAVEATKS